MATIKNIPQFTPQQMDLFQRLLAAIGPGAEQGLGFLSQLAGGDEDIFSQLEAPAYSALERGLGQTASRFSQFGAQDSSAFQNALAGQSGQLAESLGAQRVGLQQQAIERLLGSTQDLLGQRPNQQFLKQRRPGFGSFLGSAAGSLVGQAPGLLAKYFLGGA